MRIAALLTCHNRRDKTLACLEALYACSRPPRTALDVFLVDDGSTDGTTASVRERYPDVRLLSGDGSLFWNGGMHKAFGTALIGNYDAYLWLNDDTILLRSALQGLIDTWYRLAARGGKDPVVVGSTRDAASGTLTYGGVFRPVRWRPMSFKLVPPGNEPVECEAMNGNCVLIPAAVAQSVGNIDPDFGHAMGDLDYGLRARKAGFRIWVMPGYAGTCSTNSVCGTFDDESMSLPRRLKKMMQPKGLPIRSWAILTRRHGGPLWFVFWLWPYVKVIATSIVRR